jgi:hypothetical protein
MVFCSVDLDCADIYGLLVARIGESPVDNRCTSRSFNVGIVMVSIFCMGLATMRKTLSVADYGNIRLFPRGGK